MTIRKISLDDDDFKEAYLEGIFAIDCLEISLTQNGSGAPRIYKTSGTIQAGPENGVEARLVFPRDPDHPYDAFDQLREIQSVRSGEVLPDRFFYALRATDVQGNTWFHPSVGIAKIEHPNAEILTVSCDFIEAEFATDSPEPLAHFVFKDGLDIPTNKPLLSSDLVRGRERKSLKRGALMGAMDGFELSYYPVTVDKSGQSHELTAVGSKEFEPPEYFDLRLLEAIQFCAARHAWPVMTEVVRKGKRVLLLSKARNYNNGLVSPPLPSHASFDFLRLMECYYRYACKEGKGEDAAPLSKKIGGLFTLRGVWMETIALLLSVSVESVLNDPIYKRLGIPDKQAKTQIDRLFSWIKEAPVGENLIERALGATSMMKSARAKDRMYVLSRAGVVEKAEIDAWNDVRNSSAHGSFQLDPLQIQAVLDNIYRLVSMIYKLAFFKIGYQGKYSNYSARGWAEAQFDAAECAKRLGESQPPAELGAERPRGLIDRLFDFLNRKWLASRARASKAIEKKK